MLHIKQPNLQTILKQLYGNRMVKSKNIKTSYSIFTPYQDTQTSEIYYFCLSQIKTQYHLSEGTIISALTKYSPYLSPVEFLQVDKTLEQTNYLIKSSDYIISLEEIIKLKYQCQETVEKQLILKVIEFLIKIYKNKSKSQRKSTALANNNRKRSGSGSTSKSASSSTKNKSNLFPQLNPQSIGFITDQKGNEELCICDYELYFKKNDLEMRSLSENICSCVEPMIKNILENKNSLKPSFGRELYNDGNLQQQCYRSFNSSFSSNPQISHLKHIYGQPFTQLLIHLILKPIENMQKQCLFDGTTNKQIPIKQIEQHLQEYYQRVIDNEDLNRTLNETVIMDGGVYEEKDEKLIPIGHHDQRNSGQNSSNNNVLHLLNEPLLGGQIRGEQYEEEQPSSLLSSSKQNSQKYFPALRTTGSTTSTSIPNSKSPDSPSKNRKPITLVLTILTILLILTSGIILFIEFYLSSDITCDIGTYKPPNSNQCLNCPQGCLRCQSNLINSCYSCIGRMYLILENQDDVMGECEKTCDSGIILKSNFCLRKKKGDRKMGDIDVEKKGVRDNDDIGGSKRNRKIENQESGSEFSHVSITKEI